MRTEDELLDYFAHVKLVESIDDQLDKLFDEANYLESILEEADFEVSKDVYRSNFIRATVYQYDNLLLDISDLKLTRDRLNTEMDLFTSEILCLEN